MTRHIAGVGLVALLVAAPALAQPKTIQLPAPEKTGGRPLMQVLQERKSQREFRREPLPLATLSNLLWAAFGVTRPDGRRTAPSASNRQEIDLYVALADGLYVYEAKAHALKPIVAEDLRGATGTQAFAADAAVEIVYVADLARGPAPAGESVAYAYADAAFIAENVYLFCASDGLATVVRASVDRATLAKRMQLRADQRIILAQSVGLPK